MTASIDVAFTPADLDPGRPTDIALVVDVLRASSTIVAALGAGFERVLCVADVEGARRFAGPDRALAGERGCRPIEGFDYGNSPGALTSAPVTDLVLCTTNGTPAVLAAAELADQVLVASLLNLDAVVDAVSADKDVSIVCSGTDRRFALEDAYLAGRLVQRLVGTRTDAAQAAAQIAGSYADALSPLANSADAEVLRTTGQSEDIDFCARESIFDIVPQVYGAQSGVAAIHKYSAMAYAKTSLDISTSGRTLQV